MIRIETIVINENLAEAARIFQLAIKHRNHRVEKNEKETHKEGLTRVKSLLHLVHYMAFPEKLSDRQAARSLAYVKKRLLEPETKKKTDRTLVFLRREPVHKIMLSAPYIDQNDRETHESRPGQKVISLDITKEPNTQVIIRQSLAFGSYPYLFVRYSVKGLNNDYPFLLDFNNKLVSLRSFETKAEEKKVKQDLFDTLNGAAYDFGYGHPHSMQDAANMGTFLFADFTNQLNHSEIHR